MPIATSRQLVSTPSYQKMRDLCDIALDQPNGVCVPFTIKHYGDLDECKKAARGFQQLFSSFRSRARTSMQIREKSKLNELGEHKTSPYDSLACMRTVRPDGVNVNIVPSTSFEIAHEILDPVTMQPIPQTTPEMRRVAAYIQRIFTQIERENKDGSRAPTPLTLEEELDAFAIDEETFGQLYTDYRWRMKSTGMPYGEKAQAKPDLLDTSMDEFGVGE